MVDTDLKNDGPKNWSELQDMHGVVETLTARTGGGGEHWIFLAPSDRQLKNTASVIAPGIDTRAEGGYIVAPPSLHMSGQRYEWDNRTNPTNLPDWTGWPTIEEVAQKSVNGTALSSLPCPWLPALVLVAGYTSFGAACRSAHWSSKSW